MKAAGRTLDHGQFSSVVALGRNVALGFGGSISSALLGFVLTLVVAHGLGASGAGTFFVALAVFGILGSVMTFGADVGAVRTISSYQALGRNDELGAVVWAAVLPVAAVSAVVGVAFFGVSPQLAELVADGREREELEATLRFLAVFLPLTGVSSVLLAATRGFGTMVPYVATEQIAKPLVRPLAVGGAIVLGGGAAAAVFAWAAPIAVSALVGGLWVLVLLRRAGRGTARPRRLPTRALTAEFWRFSAVRGLASVFQTLTNSLDVVLVAALASPADAGIYAAVTRLLRVGGLAQRALILALGPRISALLAVGDRDGAQLLYRVSTTWLVAISFPAYLLLAAASPTVVQIFGDDFGPGAVPLTILSLAMLVNMGTGPVTTILLMAGKATWNLGNTAGSLVINVALNLLLIPPFGLTGAAIAWSAAILFENLVPAFQIARSLRLHPLSAGLLFFAAAAIVCFGGGGLVAQLLLDGSPSAFAAVATIGAAVYGGVVWRWRGPFALDALWEAVRLPRRASARPASVG